MGGGMVEGKEGARRALERRGKGRGVEERKGEGVGEEVGLKK